MSAFLMAALMSRRVETRRLSPAFMASFSWLLMVSRSTGPSCESPNRLLIYSNSWGLEAPSGLTQSALLTYLGGMTPQQPDSGWAEPRPTALLVLADGTVLEGFGLGATGLAVGAVCFTTDMAGYQDILTDPSYAGQIITFTFPHIGNVGTNEEDIETVNMAATPAARGVILHSPITDPSNYRATRHLDQWLKSRDVIGLTGIDTRALTALTRPNGIPNAVIAHSPDGSFDLAELKRQAREWPGLVGMDLVPMVTSAQRFTWDETPWQFGQGYGRQDDAPYHVVAIDYGIKRNIL